MTTGSWCKEGKIVIFKMTLELTTVLIIFSLFGTIPSKSLRCYSMLKNWKH